MTTIVVLSGGLDSTAALASALDQAPDAGDVAALSFDYGQRHRKEVLAAERIASALLVPHRTIHLAGLLVGSALLGVGRVPEGHYAEESMKATVVPGRNLLFASLAVAQAQEQDTIWFGVHAGDHPIYPDCRPEFWDTLERVVWAAYGVGIVTPWLHMSKAEVVEAGSMAGAPFHLTWSCYQGGDVHCGRCGTCVERAEAFHVAGITDPTEYADADYWREVV